jgi:hypothetical protein
MVRLAPWLWPLPHLETPSIPLRSMLAIPSLSADSSYSASLHALDMQYFQNGQKLTNCQRTTLVRLLWHVFCLTRYKRCGSLLHGSLLLLHRNTGFVMFGYLRALIWLLLKHGNVPSMDLSRDGVRIAVQKLVLRYIDNFFCAHGAILEYTKGTFQCWQQTAQQIWCISVGLKFSSWWNYLVASRQ